MDRDISPARAHPFSADPDNPGRRVDRPAREAPVPVYTPGPLLAPDHPGPSVEGTEALTDQLRLLLDETRRRAFQEGVEAGAVKVYGELISNPNPN